MKKIMLNNKEYEVMTDYKNGFDLQEVESKFTDYFESYDYVLGDWSYGKLRLKGLCTKDNKLFNSINDYNILDNYLKEECAYDCKYFVLKKINND